MMARQQTEAPADVKELLKTEETRRAGGKG
jgi:hypothetical protein